MLQRCYIIWYTSLCSPVGPSTTSFTGENCLMWLNIRLKISVSQFFLVESFKPVSPLTSTTDRCDWVCSEVHFKVHVTTPNSDVMFLQLWSPCRNIKYQCIVIHWENSPRLFPFSQPQLWSSVRLHLHLRLLQTDVLKKEETGELWGEAAIGLFFRWP